MNKDQTIQYMVAYKAAVELVVGGIAVPETDDIAAEIAALADVLNDQINERTGSGSGKSQGSKRSGTSNKRGSGGPKRKGQGSKGKGDFKWASEGQKKYIIDLLDQKAHDVEVDFDEETFEWDGETISFDKIPAPASPIIEYLVGFGDA